MQICCIFMLVANIFWQFFSSLWPWEQCIYDYYLFLLHVSLLSHINHALDRHIWLCQRTDKKRMWRSLWSWPQDCCGKESQPGGLSVVTVRSTSSGRETVLAVSEATTRGRYAPSLPGNSAGGNSTEGPSSLLFLFLSGVFG